MNRLNLDPPAPLLQSIPDQVAVIAVADNELVTIFHVGVFERDLAHSPFKNVGVSPPSLLLLSQLVLLVLLQLQHVQLLVVSFSPHRRPRQRWICH